MKRYIHASTVGDTNPEHPTDWQDAAAKIVTFFSSTFGITPEVGNIACFDEVVDYSNLGQLCHIRLEFPEGFKLSTLSIIWEVWPRCNKDHKPAAELRKYLHRYRDTTGWYELVLCQYASIEYCLKWLTKSKRIAQLLTSLSWPSSSTWKSVDLASEDGMWERYLASPEDQVNNELNVFPEPSTQSGHGSMFIFDESGSDNEAIQVNFDAWCRKQISMAASSKSADQYREKYKSYVQSLISKYWS